MSALFHLSVKIAWTHHSLWPNFDALMCIMSDLIAFWSLGLHVPSELQPSYEDKLGHALHRGIISWKSIKWQIIKTFIWNEHRYSIKLDQLIQSKCFFLLLVGPQSDRPHPRGPGSRRPSQDKKGKSGLQPVAEVSSAAPPMPPIKISERMRNEII